MNTQITIEDMDKEYTQDWQDVCVGRYTFKAPPGFIDFERRRKYSFDGYQIQVLEGTYTDAQYQKKVRELKQKAHSQVKPGLAPSLITLEEETQDSYFVGYRSRGEAHPSIIRYIGYKKIHDLVVQIEDGASDGIDETGARMQRMNNHAQKIKRIGQRLMKNIQPIGKSGPESGLCIHAGLIIEAEPVTGWGESAGISGTHHPDREKSAYGFSVSTGRTYYDQEMLGKIKKAIDVDYIKVNGMQGVHYYGSITWTTVKTKVHHRWFVLPEGEGESEVMVTGSINKYAGGIKEEADKLFYNILASLQHRG